MPCISEEKRPDWRQKRAQKTAKYIWHINEVFKKPTPERIISVARESDATKIDSDLCDVFCLKRL